MWGHGFALRIVCRNRWVTFQQVCVKKLEYITNPCLKIQYTRWKKFKYYYTHSQYTRIDSLLRAIEFEWIMMLLLSQYSRCLERRRSTYQVQGETARRYLLIQMVMIWDFFVPILYLLAFLWFFSYLFLVWKLSKRYKNNYLNRYFLNILLFKDTPDTTSATVSDDMLVVVLFTWKYTTPVLWLLRITNWKIN